MKLETAGAAIGVGGKKDKKKEDIVRESFFSREKEAENFEEENVSCQNARGTLGERTAADATGNGAAALGKPISKAEKADPCSGRFVVDSSECKNDLEKIVESRNGIGRKAIARGGSKQCDGANRTMARRRKTQAEGEV